MRFGRARRLCLMFSFVAGAGAVLVPGVVHTQPFEYVITFENAAVRGVTPSTPETAHQSCPESTRIRSPAEARTRSIQVEGTDRKAATRAGGRNRYPIDPREAREQLGTRPKVTMRLPGSLLPSEPGEGTGNPSFVQEGFLVEAFWAGKRGTREGFFKHADFHPPDLSTGFEAQHLGNPDELHGIYVRSVDGSASVSRASGIA